MQIKGQGYRQSLKLVENVGPNQSTNWNGHSEARRANHPWHRGPDECCSTSSFGICVDGALRDTRDGKLTTTERIYSGGNVYGMERPGEDDCRQVARGSSEASSDRKRSRKKQDTTHG